MMRVARRAGSRPTPGLLIAAFLAAIALTLAVSRQAMAGEYTIFACQAPEAAGYASTAFENFATRGMKWRRACNPTGPGVRGLVTANVAREGRVERGAQSAFVLNAPEGTSFSRLRWSGHAHRRDCRYALQLYAERPGAPAVAIKNVRANRNCPDPDKAQASSWPRPRAYDLGGATRIVQRVVCVGGPSGDFCSARGQNYIRTFAAEATVVDGVGPSVAIILDSPLTQGQWVRGIHQFAYEASDNVGIRVGRASLGRAQLGEELRPCNYSQRIPCPNGRGQIEVDTSRVEEGTQPIAVSAEDAAGNSATSAPVTVRIDNAAPGAVAVGLAGGESWRNQNDFDVAWTNSPEGDRAPITAAHYRICRAGNECVTGDRTGAAIGRVDNLRVPAAGEWELRLWREDAAGNQQANNASLPVRLRFDPEPPQLGFEAPSTEDPTRVSVRVTDRISGLGGGSVEIGRVGSGLWQVLPATPEDDRLVARVDDAALPPGDYELRATAHDLANNLASTDRRLDGQPMRLRLPLRIGTSMRAGIVEKRQVLRTVRRDGKKRKVRRTITGLEQQAKVPFGRRVMLAGRLLNRAGHPLANAKVLVYSRVEGGSEQLDDSVTTNARGDFAYVVQARSSRRFRFVYPGTATILPVEGEAKLLVKAYSTFAVEPNRILNGDSVFFSGRVKGRPLPETGKLVEVQFRNAGEWQTFKTLRTKPDGSWSFDYPFTRTCGVRRYPFRIHVPPEAGYPLEAGNSRVLTVRVRGRPCSSRK